MHKYVLLALFASSLAAQTFGPIAQLPTGAPALQANPSATKFTFAVAGDNRPAKRADGLTQPVKDIAKALTADPPAFIVWDGDAVFGKEDIGITTEYKDFLHLFSTVPVPLFNAPGNHELVVETTIKCGKWTSELPDFSGSMRADYLNTMGGLYGMFRYGNAAFLIINTDDDMDITLNAACDFNGYVGKAQLAALIATLQQLSTDDSVEHVFLFMHRPVHDDMNGGQIGSPNVGKSDYQNQIRAFRQAIDKGGYKKLSFVFASHDHRLYVYPPKAALARKSPGSGKPTYIITGGAGAPLSGCNGSTGGQPGSYFHYLTVTIDGPEVSVAVHPLYGTKWCAQPPS
jgi:hypothetical protein